MELHVSITPQLAAKNRAIKELKGIAGCCEIIKNGLFAEFTKGDGLLFEKFQKPVESQYLSESIKKAYKVLGIPLPVNLPHDRLMSNGEAVLMLDTAIWYAEQYCQVLRKQVYTEMCSGQNKWNIS